MYVELIVDPGAEVWYGLVEYQWEEQEVEYEEPEFSFTRKTRRVILVSDFKKSP